MKKITLGTATIIASLTLAACSNGSGSGAESEDTLEIWGMGDEGSTLKEFAKDFEEQNDVQVEVQTIPWDNAQDKLQTAVASGNGPDVVQTPMTWIPNFGKAGAFEDISEEIESGEYENITPDNFFEDSVNTTKYNGDTLGVPWFVETRVLYYRTDLLEEQGYPEGPQTWDETLDVASKLADRGEGQFGLEIAEEDGNMPFLLAKQRGWDYDPSKGAENFKDPAFTEALELYDNVFEQGLSQQGEGKEITQAFADGSVPMFFDGPWTMDIIKDDRPELEGKWDITTMPEAENGQSNIGGTHLTVFNETNNKETALEFINYMADSDTQKEWYNEMNSLPANTSTWEDPELADDPMLNVYQEQLNETATPLMLPQYEQMADELVQTIEQIIKNDRPVDEALDDYSQRIDGLLEE